MKTLSLVLGTALAVVGAQSVWSRTKPLRAQTAPSVVPANFTFRLTGTPGPVRTSILTVPPGYRVRVTGVSVLEALNNSVHYAELFEWNGDVTRWRFARIEYEGPVVSAAAPEPGVVFSAGETIGFVSNLGYGTALFGMTGWVERVD